MAILFISCQPPADNSVNEAFENNSKVALAEIEGWENESMDYDAVYASDALFYPTGFNSPDSVTLDETKENNAKMWAGFDFELLHDPVFLPGVNAETNLADGSVRYYGVWKVTLPATDSTEERSGNLKLYESFDFDSEGKIAYQQAFGDFGGLFNHLMSTEDDTESDTSEEGEAEAAE